MFRLPGAPAPRRRTGSSDRAPHPLAQQQQRAGKRQAAPFAERSPKPNPKKPGRKPGKDYGTKAYRPPPERIDEVHETPLADACPDCGGPIEPSHVDQQYQVEIPRQPIRRQFNIHVGCCWQCRRRIQGRPPRGRTFWFPTC